MEVRRQRHDGKRFGCVPLPNLRAERAFALASSFSLSLGAAVIWSEQPLRDFRDVFDRGVEGQRRHHAVRDRARYRRHRRADRRGRRDGVGVRPFVRLRPRPSRGAAGLPIARLVLHEPPYNPYDEDHRLATREEAKRIETLLAEDRRGDAVENFCLSVGMPREVVEGMRHTPRWAELEAMAPTMAYDSELMGDIGRGATVPSDLAGRVRCEPLVLIGGASPEGMIDVARQLAEAVPNSQCRVLEGQEHVVPPGYSRRS